MHIILGALALLVTLPILLKRLADAGIDLGGLNPFLWRRRRKWQEKFAGNPAFLVADPKEISEGSGPPSQRQRELIAAIRSKLSHTRPAGAWN